jgi:hypothetical protein
LSDPLIAHQDVNYGIDRFLTRVADEKEGSWQFQMPEESLDLLGNHRNASNLSCVETFSRKSFT